MSAEAAPKLTQEDAPASGERKRRKSEEGASNVIPLASFKEQMEDVEAAQSESKSKKRPRTHTSVRVVERTRTSEVEREHLEQGMAKVISLRGKREEWQKELERLEGKAKLSVEEFKNYTILSNHIKKVDIIEEHAEEMEKLEMYEEHAEDVEREIREERTFLEEKEHKHNEAEVKLEDQKRGLEEEKKHLKVLTEQLASDPTNEIGEEKKRITEHLIVEDRNVAKLQRVINALKQEESQFESRLNGWMGVREKWVGIIAASNERIVKLNLQMVEKGIPMEDVEMPEERPRHIPVEKKEEKKEETFKRSKSSKLGTAAIIVGLPLALGAGVLVVGGRLFNTFFRNIYKLAMDPGKFFSELGSKYSSAMEDPPKGKGKVQGFLSGTKWLFIGDPEPKKEKKKE